MSRRERATRVVVAGVAAGLLFSLFRGSLWTVSMLWEISYWIAVLAVLSLLDSYLERRRKAKHS